MFTEVTAFRCSKCEKLYVQKEAPAACTCSVQFQPGNIIGSFQLQEKLEDRNWNVICLLCSLETVMNATNMKRQKSCGCKPKHIELLSSNEEEARYRCRKCGTNYTESTPILFWCCSEEE